MYNFKTIEAAAPAVSQLRGFTVLGFLSSCNKHVRYKGLCGGVRHLLRASFVAKAYTYFFSFQESRNSLSRFHDFVSYFFFVIFVCFLISRNNR